MKDIGFELLNSMIARRDIVSLTKLKPLIGDDDPRWFVPAVNALSTALESTGQSTRSFAKDPERVAACLEWIIALPMPSAWAIENYISAIHKIITFYGQTYYKHDQFADEMHDYPQTIRRHIKTMLALNADDIYSLQRNNQAINEHPQLQAVITKHQENVITKVL